MKILMTSFQFHLSAFFSLRGQIHGNECIEIFVLLQIAGSRLACEISCHAILNSMTRPEQEKHIADPGIFRCNRVTKAKQTSLFLFQSIMIH